MADKRDVFDNESLSHNNEPRLSHMLDKGLDPNSIDEAPTEIRRAKAKSKHVPWFKNSEVVKVVVAGAVVLVVVLIVLVWQFGLFGGSSQSKQPIAASPNPDQSPTDQSPPPQPTQEAQPNSTEQTPEPKPEEESADEKPPEEEEPPLPDDVTEWRGKVFFRARRENNPKLIEAVAHLGNKKYSGNEKVAKGLIKLLKPLEPEEPAEKTDDEKNNPDNLDAPSPEPEIPSLNPLSPKQNKLPGLIEAIVAALGNNGSEIAQNTIEEVLSGKFKTDDDKAAVEAALKTLLVHPGQETNALMIRVLTEPGILRPYDRQGPWPQKEFQAKAFELTKKSASSGLRLALAKALVEHNVKLNPKDPMHEFLLASDPLNCGAQLTFYEKGHPTVELKTRLEEQFLVYSSLAMARYLDIPDKLDQSTHGLGAPDMHAGQPGGLIGGFDLPDDLLTKPKPASGTPANPSTNPGDKVGVEEAKPKKENPASQVAVGLWSPQFLALLEPMLTTHALDSLEKKPKLVLLASTIPQDSTRALLNKLLRKRWSEGPKALETAGLTEKVVTDPGMLTLIKMLHRRGPKTSARGTPRVTRHTGGTVNKRIEEAHKRQKTAEKWMDLSSKMVAVWCKRFHAATQARQKADAESETDSEAVPLKLPDGFELSPNARVIASFHLIWPDEAPPEIAKLNPGWLEVYYIRVEEVSKLRKAKAYYSRQADLRSSDARTIDKSTWLDNVRIGSQKDRRRSLDVLITPPKNYVPADNPRNEDETDLIIEILSVEIKDPTK